MTIYTEIFDKALALEEGYKIEIPCHNKGYLNSVRVSLHREKAKWEKLNNKICTVSISTRSGPTGNYVTLEKVPSDQVPMILTTSGEIIGPAFGEAKMVLDRQHISEVMRQDGMSEEDIESYWKDNPETSNFDTPDEAHDEGDNN